MEQRKAEKISEAEPATTRSSTSDDRGPSIVHEAIGVSSDFVRNLKVKVPCESIHLIVSYVYISTEFESSQVQHI